MMTARPSASNGWTATNSTCRRQSWTVRTVLPYQPRILAAAARVRKLNLWHENPAVEVVGLWRPGIRRMANLYRELIHWLCDGRADCAEQVFRWAACSLYRMDERMRYALLCISHEKGNGQVAGV